MVEEWRKMNAKSKVIHQAELLPILVALMTWQDVMAGRRISIFVDSDAARSAVIKGATASPASAQIVAEIWERVVQSEMQLWVGSADCLQCSRRPVQTRLDGCEEVGCNNGYTKSIAHYQVGMVACNAWRRS